MWRRVASQSPTAPPANTNETQDAGKYLNAWQALGKMLANGRSLSGRERNCCFLNTGNAKFANISAASGFDFPDDTRGVTVTDWDQDGDLDIWTTNRTAPRVRFLRNNYSSGQNSVSLKLAGVKSNRDGIGSRVEVDLGTTGGKLVRALRAGEGYLGQSSKWLHFGLGPATDVKQVIVRWPNGKREVFGGVVANGRFTLVEGRGTAIRESVRRAETSRASAMADRTVPPSPTGIARIVLPARLPMPSLTYLDLQRNEVPLIDRPKAPLLINLWATWCQPCLTELAEWSQHEQEFTKAGVNVVLLCVDEATEKPSVDASAVTQLLKRLEIPYSAGFATPELLDALDITQQMLTKRIRPLPIPSSFLVDAQGRLAVVYKGQAAVNQVLFDIGNLSLASDKHRDLAVAFPGTWYTNPFPPDLLAIPQKFQDVGQPEQALSYLKRHAPEFMDDSSSGSFDQIVSPENVASIYIQLAQLLQAKGKRGEVIESLQAAAELQPSDARPRLALAMIFQQAGRPADAELQYRTFLKRNPEDPVISNNLAWLLATCADPAVRKPAEAIKLAESVCEKSRRQLPSTLDTLAAAYAAAGRFDDAVSTMNEALSLLQSAGQDINSGVLRDRLLLYQQRMAFIEPGSEE